MTARSRIILTAPIFRTVHNMTSGLERRLRSPIDTFCHLTTSNYYVNMSRGYRPKPAPALTVSRVPLFAASHSPNFPGRRRDAGRCVG